jgi:hypothetical protein
MSDWEQAHIAEAFAFELNQVESEEVRHHVMNELLVNIADALAEAVSAQTGIEIAPVGSPENPTPSAPTPSGPLRPEAKDLSSPALSQDKPGDTIKGRRIAVLGGDGVDARQLKAVNDALMAQEALVELSAAHAGMITDSAGKPQKVNRAAPNAPSVIYDAVCIECWHAINNDEPVNVALQLHQQLFAEGIFDAHKTSSTSSAAPHALTSPASTTNAAEDVSASRKRHGRCHQGLIQRRPLRCNRLKMRSPNWPSCTSWSRLCADRRAPGHIHGQS